MVVPVTWQRSNLTKFATWVSCSFRSAAEQGLCPAPQSCLLFLFRRRLDIELKAVPGGDLLGQDARHQLVLLHHAHPPGGREGSSLSEAHSFEPSCGEHLGLGTVEGAFVHSLGCRKIVLEHRSYAMHIQRYLAQSPELASHQRTTPGGNFTPPRLCTSLWLQNCLKDLYKSNIPTSSNDGPNPRDDFTARSCNIVTSPRSSS